MTSPVPQAIDSERAVLAEVLIDATSFPVAAGFLSDDDFYVDSHRAIWVAIRATVAEGDYDAGRVRDKIAAHTPRALDALVALFGETPWGSLEYHCARISSTGCLRALNVLGRRLVQRTESGVGQYEGDPVNLAEGAIDELRLIQAMGTVPTHDEIEVHDAAQRATDTMFVIPGLLAQGNRIVITAPEGYGKSSLLRQIACCAAAGVHPFKPLARIRPVKAVVIDCENPAEINTVEYRRVLHSLAKMEADPSRDMLWIEELGPTNLLDPRIAARVYALIERRKPELIVIGPVYQLHEDNPNDEGPARKLSAVLDRLRLISGAALITEAHTPHNDGSAGQLMRPYGASLWKRWPEFGYCLHPIVSDKEIRDAEEKLAAAKSPNVRAELGANLDALKGRRNQRESHFTPWRGARAIRDWPEKLKVGGVLPWVTMP